MLLGRVLLGKSTTREHSHLSEIFGVETLETTPATLRAPVFTARKMNLRYSVEQKESTSVMFIPRTQVPSSIGFNFILN